MKKAKDFIKNNRTALIGAVIIFLASISLGAFFSCKISPSQVHELKEYIIPYLQKDVVSKISFINIFKTSALNHLKFIIVAIIGAVSIYALPLFIFAFAIRGYQLGFTIGFISHNFGARGILLSLSSVILFYALALPAYFFVFVTETNYVLKQTKWWRNSKDKRSSLLSYFSFLLLIYFYLCVSALAEAVLTPLIISVIN